MLAQGMVVLTRAAVPPVLSDTGSLHALDNQRSLVPVVAQLCDRFQRAVVREAGGHLLSHRGIKQRAMALLTSFQDA